MTTRTADLIYPTFADRTHALLPNTDLVIVVLAAVLALWVVLSCGVAVIVCTAIRIADDQDGPASSR